MQIITQIYYIVCTIRACLMLLKSNEWRLYYNKYLYLEKLLPTSTEAIVAKQIWNESNIQHWGRLTYYNMMNAEVGF